MKLSTHIKPVSYLKAHTSQVMREINESQEPLVITHNGEAKVVMQDVDSWQKTQEALALLKILALGEKQVAEGKVKPASEVIARIRARK